MSTRGAITPVTRIVETVLPTRHGLFRLTGFAGHDGTEHVALSLGVTDGAPPRQAPLVRLHSECLTGDALGSWRCDCGFQLDAALARIAADGVGALIYLRGHEGRGIGLLEKLKAYRLQDQGADTVDANLSLGHPCDRRQYTQAAAILQDLGLTRIRLMTSNPAKEQGLRDHGIDVVERTGMFVPLRAENGHYLRTKQARMGHDKPLGDAWADLVAGRLPVSTPTEGDLVLVDRYGPVVSSDGHLTLAQMAQSLDGFIATLSGDGEALSGPADHSHLHRLRALVDAVMIGCNTVLADDPRLTVREVTGPNPVRVVIDPRGRIPGHAALLTDGAAPTIWLVGRDAEVSAGASHVNLVRLDPPGFAPARLLSWLNARGLSKVLVEGGGRTVSRFLEAGCLDRLYVTTVPVLLGDGVPGVRVPPVQRIADAARRRSRRHVLGDDVCTELILTEPEPPLA